MELRFDENNLQILKSHFNLRSHKDVFEKFKRRIFFDAGGWTGTERNFLFGRRKGISEVQPKL